MGWPSQRDVRPARDALAGTARRRGAAPLMRLPAPPTHTPVTRAPLRPTPLPLLQLIAELQGLVLEKQHQVEALSQTRRALRARAAVAQAAVSHCEALVQLAAALQRRGVPGCQGPERGHKQQQQQQQEQEGGGEPAAAGESACQPAGGGAGSSSNAGAPPAATDTPCSGGSTSCSAA
jgi:hypothetical protein